MKPRVIISGAALVVPKAFSTPSSMPALTAHAYATMMMPMISVHGVRFVYTMRDSSELY